MKRKDLTDMRFGHLVVTKMLYDYKGDGRSYCNCVCDCGKTVVTQAYKLQHRDNASCGCMSNYYRSLNNRNDIKGKTFGRLTVLNIDYSSKPSTANCKCSCGNITNVVCRDIAAGHTKSCGCLQKERASMSNTKDFTNIISDSGVRIKHRSFKTSRGTWMWNCECPICGKDFLALPARVLENHTTSCGCKIKSAKERFISSYLDSLNVNYETQKRFKDCKYHYTLPFDFAIYNQDNSLNCLIEYDGQQHSKPVELFGGNDGFHKTQIRDAIKNDYCRSNNIKLLRLDDTYTNKDIKEIITNTIYP